MMVSAGAAVPLSSDLKSVLRLLDANAERLFGAGDTVLEPLTCQVRESSEVARVRVSAPAGERHVFIKLVKPRKAVDAAAETRRRLLHDVQVTTQVAEGLKRTPDLRAVEIIANFDEPLAVITEQAPGTPLDRFIATYGRWPARKSSIANLSAVLSRAGRWIAAFQRVAPDASPSHLDVAAIREYIDVRLRKLRTVKRSRFGEEERQAILRHFDARATEIPRNDLIEVPVHGDVTPSNIIVAPERLTVLDFAMTSRGSRFLDIARLYTQLEFYTAKPQYRPAVIRQVQDAALAGYDPALTRDHPLFEICAIQHVVCHYLSHARQPGRFPASLYSDVQLRHHRRWLRDLTLRSTSTCDAGQAVATR
jgi:Ser/Thr protein kinase RdoA (MazF antagonist)